MLRKKLLALECAIAITALGACFLPPEHLPRPQLPPDSEHIHSFAVQVMDLSRQDLVDEIAMNQAVAQEFNDLWKNPSIQAEPIEPSRWGRVKLEIVLHRKSISILNLPSGEQSWTCEAMSEFTLTAPSGRVLWQKREESIRFEIPYGRSFRSDRWNSPIVRKKAAHLLAKAAGEIRNLPSLQYSSERYP